MKEMEELSVWQIVAVMEQLPDATEYLHSINLGSSAQEVFAEFLFDHPGEREKAERMMKEVV